MNTGISLSGGGLRASVFHLGALARMNDADLLKQIGFISTVSGGTLMVGLIYASNDYSWPVLQQSFNDKVIPKVYQKLTTEDLQLGVILDTILVPVRIFISRAGIVSRRIKNNWGIDKSIRDLPGTPRWIINATCYETSRNWRFETHSSHGTSRMGGVHFGYELSPDYPLCDAMAASAGLPVLIGPITLETCNRQWVKFPSKPGGPPQKTDPKFKKVHLWDGGVYDNLGLEPLDRPEVKRLFVSNASGKISAEKKYSPGVGALMRLISIAKFQVEALRGRDVIHNYEDHKLSGNYFNTGNFCRKILESALNILGVDAGYEASDISTLCQSYLSEEDAEDAATMRTEIRKLTEEEFTLLFRHGYEVADCTLFAYGKGTYQLLTYDAGRWNALFSG